MSDYKAIKTDIECTEATLVVEALKEMGIVAELNVVARQRWKFHNRQVDICIRQDSLPENLRGFGDVGFVKRGNKFEFLGCSEHDSGYMDRDKRQQLMEKGMSDRNALAAQPDGKFTAELTAFSGKIACGHAAMKVKRDILKVAPGTQFSRPTGVKGDSRAWMQRGAVKASDLAKLGINVRT